MSFEGWKEVRLSKIMEIVGGGTPKSSVDEYWNGSIPWLSVKDFNNEFRKVYTTEKTITELGLSNSSTKLLNKGDLIISARGTVGVLAQLGKPMTFNQSCYGLRAKPPITNDFLYYLLKSNMNHLKRNTHGSVFDTITRGTFDSIEVDLPPEREQRLITSILSSLDEKIELNHRINQNLEEMAQAIFKSWFIDFEPFQEGEFVESELGPIPKGWNIVSLSDICTTQYGYTTSAKEEPVGPKFLRVKDINKQNWIKWDEAPHVEISQKDYEKYKLKFGDIVVSRMADPGKSAIIDDDSVEAVFASYLVRLLTESVDTSFYIYYFLKSSLYERYCQGAIGGSVQKNMNARVITGVKLVLPPEKVLFEFKELILPFRKYIVSNLKESEYLSSLRDTLLPKLMSGEIRVPLEKEEALL